MNLQLKGEIKLKKSRKKEIVNVKVETNEIENINSFRKLFKNNKCIMN